jgi:hypothetical protein
MSSAKPARMLAALLPQCSARPDVGSTPISVQREVRLSYRHEVPVRTSIILLRPAADGTELSGLWELRLPEGDVYNWFRYNVVRVWQQPIDEILTAGMPILPLAPISNVDRDALPGVLLAISERLIRETSPDQAATLWTATKVMMGLRYSTDEVEEITRRVSAMILGIRGIEESSVYQDIFAKGEARGEAKGEARGEAKGEAKGKVAGRAEGRTEEAREALVRVGRRRFGPPDGAVLGKIDAMDDVDTLNSMLDRILDVSSWDELLT